MNIVDMIDEKLVSFDFEASDKDDVLKKVGKMMYDAGKVTDLNKYIDGLYKREEEFATGMGNGIAIPHCKSDCVKDAAFSLVKLKNPVEWGSLDDEPVDYIIMLAAPNSSDNTHLKMLSQVAAKLMDDDFREGLKDAADFGQIIDIFNKGKEEK